MKKMRFVEVTSTENKLTQFIVEAINKAGDEGFEFDSIQYSTSFDQVHNKVRSCALIMLVKVK